MTPAEEIFGLSRDLLWLHVIVFLRVGPVISLLPGFGEQSVPMRIKLAIAMAMTVIIAPATFPDLRNFVIEPPPLGWLVLSESLIGLIIGIGIRFFLLGLQTAGSMAAQSTSLTQILGNTGLTPLPAMGFILVIGALALAMMSGLHVRVAEMLILSYGLFPPAELPNVDAVTFWGVRQIAGAFALAFTLAAPFLIISVLYNLTLGIINRAMPQMMVVFVGAPVITLGGLYLLFLTAPTMLSLWVTALNGFLENPFGG